MFHWKWMTNEDALEIVAWEYEGKYAFYNIQNDVDDLDEFLNPFHWNHYAAVYENDNLAGFFTFTPLDIHTVEIGLGLRPDLTGKGKGRDFVSFAEDTAVKWYDPKQLVVKVAQFNERAIHIYKQAGFSEKETFLQKTNDSEYPFVRMEKTVSS